MSDEQQPRAEWIFPEQKKSNKGRLWLIIGLIVAALAIVGAVLFFVIPRDEAPGAGSSESPSPSPSATSTSTATPAPSPSPSASAAPEPSMTPSTSPPPAPDPDLATFAARVQPRLDDAVRGLDLVRDNMDAGAQIVDSLQQDAAVLSGTAAPSSLSDDWSAAVTDYAEKLNDLRVAFDGGSDPEGALNASRASLSDLRAVAGL